MDNYQIAIIKPNKLFYSEVDRTFSKLVLENVEEHIEDYVELKKIDTRKLMEEIVDILNMPDLIAHTSRCHENEEYIYELCYHSDSTGTVNNIATHLTKFTDRVVGNAVLIKSRLNFDNSGQMTDISLTDVADIYRKIFVHTGIVVNPSGSVDEYPYIFNPLDLVKPEELQNIKFYEFKIFDKVIQMFIEVNPTDNRINELATILYGENTIIGKVRFAMRYTFNDVKMTECEYCELTKDNFNQLVCYSSDFELSSNRHEDNEDANQDTKKPVNKIINFYTHLKEKYNKYKDKYGSQPNKDLLEKLKDKETLNYLAF